MIFSCWSSFEFIDLTLDWIKSAIKSTCSFLNFTYYYLFLKMEYLQSLPSGSLHKTLRHSLIHQRADRRNIWLLLWILIFHWNIGFCILCIFSPIFFDLSYFEVLRLQFLWYIWDFFYWLFNPLVIDQVFLLFNIWNNKS